MEPVNYDKMRALLTTRLRRARAVIEVIDVARAVVHEFNGERITASLGRALGSRLPKGYDSFYTTRALTAYGNGIAFTQSLQMELPRDPTTRRLSYHLFVGGTEPDYAAARQEIYALEDVYNNLGVLVSRLTEAERELRRCRERFGVMEMYLDQDSMRKWD